jgi:hypothetical protein
MAVEFILKISILKYNHNDLSLEEKIVERRRSSRMKEKKISCETSALLCVKVDKNDKPFKSEKKTHQKKKQKYLKIT